MVMENQEMVMDKYFVKFLKSVGTLCENSGQSQSVQHLETTTWGRIIFSTLVSMECWSPKD